MPVFETYSSRTAQGAAPGYIYDQLPDQLRHQLTRIFTECIGPGWKVSSDQFGSSPPNANNEWEHIAEIMDKEIWSFSQSENRYAHQRCIQYLKTSRDLEGALSLIEICCQRMDIIADFESVNLRAARGATEDPAKGILELNERFLRAGVGYQFENGEIIRVDSQYVHAEVVKEALRLLCEPEFEEANEEFMTAHRHLREGKLRDCNTAALRATENILKVICDARGWAYQEGDTVERLLAVARRERLFPDYLGGYFDNLVGAMKAGVPKIRDRQGGHGAAPGDEPVPDHVAAFALHLTTSNILMLVKAHQSLPPPAPAATVVETEWR
jgi:hypothetical protein